MDSGDEDAGEDSAESANEEEEPPLPDSVTEVQSFSEMVRMTPKLKAEAPRMSAPDLAAICVAAGRVKFYDADLLDAVARELKHRLRASTPWVIQPQEVASVLISLAELNAYNRELFSEAVRILGSGNQCMSLDSKCLTQLLASLRSVKHSGDDDFMEALTRVERHARYEAAKEDIVKDELERRWVR